MNIKNMGLLTVLLSGLTLATVPLTANAGDVHWTYAGKHGAEHWGSLSAKFATCDSGVNQSPINITETIDASLPALTINYQASTVNVVNNGHTVQANIKGKNTFTNDAGTFDLKQFHFHAPSENTIDGQSFPLEVHFVHADHNGRLSVIGVMFEYGAENVTLAKIWQKMPSKAGATQSLSELLNSGDLLPASTDYYRFNGSLTTPPCSEGVRWFVMKDAITASKAQIEKFAKTMGGASNRPVQSTNARVILR
ncbi:MAG: carbonic anhydrase family protein [Colwellia sp.]|nr:carbonic anhydrase family protein [Colwellia sp.]